ncbi:Hypothetical predicted protein [Xyrichtys novacula]|uniref:Uncharacterized protein n=1 Tax=Xyrichtys novacula TaxID=13765 RepID=A0AAV1GFG3_XYRNO|nr:Hypothetical predicted protein [Xyrichtys novacula]
MPEDTNAILEGANVTLMQSVIILSDLPTGGEESQEGQAGQESLESCDNPQGVVESDKETKKAELQCVAARPQVKRRKAFHPAGFHNSKQRAPPKFPSFICFQSSHEPLGYILEAGGLEGYICSGTIYRALLLLQTWQIARGGAAARPTWSAVSPPNPPLVVVTNTVRCWFLPRRPSTTATARERHHNLEIRTE